MSIGAAHSTGGLGDALLESADRALYRATGTGGNAVCWADEA